MRETRHQTTRGEFVFTGTVLYRVTATTDDGQTASAVIAANDEWKARTRLLAIQDTMVLRGQSVSYDVQ